MLTLVILLVLLFAPYLVARAIRLSSKRCEWAGVVGLVAVFLFTGFGHFVKTEAMAQMIPCLVPKRPLIIRVSGVVEILAAVALLVPGLRLRMGWFLLVLLVLLLPFNIYAALNRVPMGGHEWGPVYLLIRIPLQFVLMCWTYRFAIQPTRRSA